MNERKAAAKRQALLQQSKQSDLEEEAKERAQHLLQRANRMRMEQEDEIKEFSEVRPEGPPSPSPTSLNQGGEVARGALSPTGHRGTVRMSSERCLLLPRVVFFLFPPPAL